ncbi:unnamed protein product [Amoebophrya sp. A120]|nr:unnamed protein product [Amoebophrya sp. A120]|eukprot:GSA120T00017763001.1
MALQTLAALLETPGPGDEVLGFLHGAEVAALACVSAETRKAVSREQDGKLRCANLVIRFKCRKRKDHGIDLWAQRRDLAHVFARVDVAAVKSLLVEFRADTGADADRVYVDRVLDQVQSLMGPELRQFGLMAPQLGAPTDNNRLEYLSVVLASDRAFNHFARSLVSLSKLETLFIPSALATSPINFPPGVKTHLPRLKALHVVDAFHLDEVKPASLVCAMLGHRNNNSNNLEENKDVPLAAPSGCSSSGVVASASVPDKRTTRLAVFSCRELDCDDMDEMGTSNDGEEPTTTAGVELWRETIAPGLQKLSLITDDEDDLLDADWFWSCCKNVRHLETSFTGGDEWKWGKYFPNLESLTFTQLRYDGLTCGFRRPLVGLMHEFEFSRQRLVFCDSELSAVELAMLTAAWSKTSVRGRGGGSSGRKEGNGRVVGQQEVLEQSSQTRASQSSETTAPPPLVLDATSSRLLEMLHADINQRTFKITTGPPLCPMTQTEVAAYRQA